MDIMLLCHTGVLHGVWWGQIPDLRAGIVLSVLIQTLERITLDGPGSSLKLRKTVVSLPDNRGGPDDRGGVDPLLNHVGDEASLALIAAPDCNIGGINDLPPEDLSVIVSIMWSPIADAIDGLEPAAPFIAILPPPGDCDA